MPKTRETNSQAPSKARSSSRAGSLGPPPKETAAIARHNGDEQHRLPPPILGSSDRPGGTSATLPPRQGSSENAIPFSRRDASEGHDGSCRPDCPPGADDPRAIPAVGARDDEWMALGRMAERRKAVLIAGVIGGHQGIPPRSVQQGCRTSAAQPVIRRPGRRHRPRLPRRT